MGFPCNKPSLGTPIYGNPHMVTVGFDPQKIRWIREFQGTLRTAHSTVLCPQDFVVLPIGKSGNGIIETVTVP